MTSTSAALMSAGEALGACLKLRHGTRRAEAEQPQTLPQRVAVDPEDACGLELIAARRREHRREQRALELRDDGAVQPATLFLDQHRQHRAQRLCEHLLQVRHATHPSPLAQSEGASTAPSETSPGKGV